MKRMGLGMTLLVGICLAMLAAAVGTACGGGGDGESEPTPDRPALEAMLSDIALKVEDLPEDLRGSFTLTEEGFSDNEKVAANDPEGPTVAMERLTGWHRLLGHDSAYTAKDLYGTFLNGGTAMIRASVNIFGDERGAMDALQWGRDLLSDPEDAATFIPGVAELQGEPISVPTIGDDTVAYEFTGIFKAENFDVDVPFTAHIVAIRHGHGVANVVVVAIGGAKPGPEVEAILRELDERMGEALD